MADPNVDFTSVAALLDAASSELEVGQLLSTSVFSLFEAMSAVEIGNPKMDPGARPSGDPTPLEQRALLLQLPPGQLLAVMDRLMRLEATWHNGGSLAMTVYSSLYMMQPERTAAGNALLAAFCSGLEATCCEVNHLIMQGCVCEEEDFNAHLTGLPVEHRRTAAGAPATGEQQQQQQQQQPPAAAAAGTGGKKAKKQSAAAAAAAAAAVAAAAAFDKLISQLEKAAAGSAAAVAGDAAAADAIAARLLFRKQLLQGLVRLKQRGADDLAAASRHFSKALAQLTVVTQTLGLAKEEEGQAPLGIDEHMNSGLLPAVPPRTVPLFSGEQAVAHFGALLAALQKACAVTAVDSYRTLKDFIMEFTATPVGPIARSALHIQVSYNAWLPLPPAPDAAAAAGGTPAASSSSSSSSSSTAAASNSGPSIVDAQHPHQHAHTAPVLAHCSDTTSSSSSSSSNQQQQQQQQQAPKGTIDAAAAAAAVAAAAGVALPAWCLLPGMLRGALQLTGSAGDDGDMFLEQAVIATGNLVQALLMNRSRCRRRLRRGLEDWGHLLAHALNADSSPAFIAYRAAHGWHWHNEQPDDPTGPLATWVEAETAWVMIRHLLMGFELQLYEPADYGMIYWHIDFLGTVMQQDLKLLQDFQPTITTPAKPHAATGKKGSAAGSAKAANGHASGTSAGPRLPGKGGSKAQQQQQPPQPPPAHFMVTNLVIESWKHLSVGLLRAMMSLGLLGMYTPPQLPFNSEAQRYDQRFASFHLLQRPEPLSYEQFLTSTNTDGVPPEQLLRLAFDSFRKAQQACSLLRAQAAAWQVSKPLLQEAAQLERVAATNAIAASLLSRAAAGGGSGSGSSSSAPMFKPLYEFGHHKLFPTLTLKSAAGGAGAAAKQEAGSNSSSSSSSTAAAVAT